MFQLNENQWMFQLPVFFLASKFFYIIIDNTNHSIKHIIKSVLIIICNRKQQQGLCMILRSFKKKYYVII